MQFNDSIEILIIKELLNNDSFARKVLPILKDEYFIDRTEQVVFSNIKEFISKYNSLPSKEGLLIQISTAPTDAKNKISDDDYKQICEFVNEIKYDRPTDEKFLVEKTDDFAKTRAFCIALQKSVQIVENNNNTDLGMAIKYMEDALSVSLDPKVGQSFEDWEQQYEHMHRQVEKIPFDLTCFNKITKGGVERKSLNVILASTGLGKTHMMCHLAASSFLDGKNVLYITLEMAENKIFERLYANIFNVALDDLEKLPKDSWRKKIDAIHSKSIGKLQVKEYATAHASVIQFRALMNELRLKKNFIPDVVFVDYLNIATSSRIKLGNQVNSYQYVKSIAEELRGMAVEYNVPIWTATQTNRAAFNASEVGMEHTSESAGIPMTADFLIALSRNEDLDKMNQILVTQLKNRYNDVTYFRRFLLGVDRSRMRFYDVEESAQKSIIETGQRERPEKDVPAFDKSPFGLKMTERKDFTSINIKDDDDDLI